DAELGPDPQPRHDPLLEPSLAVGTGAAGTPLTVRPRPPGRHSPWAEATGAPLTVGPGPLGRRSPPERERPGRHSPWEPEPLGRHSIRAREPPGRHST